MSATTTHNHSTQNNKGISSPCPSEAHHQAGGTAPQKFRIEATIRDPRETNDAENVRDELATDSRSLLNRLFLTYLRQGYWVSVYAADGECLAGPFDPDEAAPALLF